MKIYKDTSGEGQARGAEEENEGDSTCKVGCWFLGFDPNRIRS